jgi:hypothetical protein
MPKQIVCLRDRIITGAGDNNIDFPLYGDWNIIAIEVRYDGTNPCLLAVSIEPDTEAPLWASVSALGIKSGFCNTRHNLTWNGRVPTSGNAKIRATTSAAEAGHAFNVSIVLEKR